MKTPAVRLSAGAVAVTAVLAALLFTPSTALAQYQPRPLNDPATGESYHIEAGVGLWFPTATIVVASESLGISGTSINFTNDLGVQDKRLPAVQLVLRPSRKTKFRLEYIPIKLQATSTLQRAIVFNGQRYNIGVPVNALMDWKAYRFGIEYDVVSRNRGFGGLILDVKYTDALVQLTSPVNNEFVEAKAPIPTIGAIGRYYVVPNISLTAEMTGFSLSWLPASWVKDNSGHFVNVDIYGTINFTNNLGVQAGYRSMDVGYTLKSTVPTQCPATSSGNAGCFTLKGPYIGAVARF